MSPPTAPRSMLRLLCLLLVAAALGGCATAPGRTSTDDPWQGMNRSIYKFNDAVDRATLKPVARGYQKVTPQWFRTGVRNFFNHLETPWVMVNELLQGKPGLMAQQTCRFVLNSVVGLGGFIDVAGKLELSAQNEDFGQTLAVWGAPSGPYIMLPFLGPSTVRDGFGRVPDYYGNPVRYADLPWETETTLDVLDLVETREALLSVEETLNQAYDRYGIMRDAWLQRREYLIYDGAPPEPALEDDIGMEDDAAETSPQTTSDAAPAEQPVAP